MSKLPEKAHVLDHGFVEIVDIMGDDQAIVDAARVSYAKGTKKTRSTRGLLRSLMRRGHTSPFEMCEVKLHVKMPIFVARQWIRYRTANVNEMSARYSLVSGEYYIPDASRIQGQSKEDKQCSDGVQVGSANAFRQLTSGTIFVAENNYASAIEGGVARELARINLPINLYTEWIWKNDLHNVLHFLRQRMDDHAQYEIRVYANALLEQLRVLFPLTIEAFEDYRLNAVTFSALELACIGDMLAGLNPLYEGMSKTERREFDAKIAKATRA